MIEPAGAIAQSSSAHAPGPAGDGVTEAYGLRRQCTLLLAACGATFLLALVLWLGGGSGELAARRARAADVAADAAAIRSLRDTPRQAAEIGVPAQDLLDRTARAMKAASIEPTCLVSTLPQPARRALGSDRAEVATRLLFENLRLESLLRCCEALCPAEDSWRVTGLQLRAATTPGLWNADVTVAYWIIAPQPGPKPDGQR